MNIEKIDVPSSNITLPLNQSVQQANGAQFALMLSLLFESKLESTVAMVSQTSSAGFIAQPIRQHPPEFNLETSQTRALNNHQYSHFQLMHSLYAERSTKVDQALDAFVTYGSAETNTVVQEIEHRRGNETVNREAEKIRFAAPSQTT
jgi:hypothetical protein